MPKVSSPDVGAPTDIELGVEAPMKAPGVSCFVWKDVTVRVTDWKSKASKSILCASTGMAKEGEILAVIGPSGSGKSTLLNVLAGRQAAAGASVEGEIVVNDHLVHASEWKKVKMRTIAAYVEQEDALCGALTVGETLQFAARLSGRTTSCKPLLDALGLTDRRNDLIGTPIRKGISGGEKRRVSIAEQLITQPKVLFLDEPTSGLDSTSSREVIKCVREIAVKLNLIVIMSIHQPSSSVYGMFDNLVLLDKGWTIFSSKISDAPSYFERHGYPTSPPFNPAEYLLDLVNQDYGSAGRNTTDILAWQWSQSDHQRRLFNSIGASIAAAQLFNSETSPREDRVPLMVIISTLMYRSWIKSYRDVIAYGIRMAMYMCLAILMGTVWLRPNLSQDNIQAFINAIFFGGAFLSFMAVAYIPAFLEDRALFIKERAHGLYGPVPFLLANFLTAIPYLFSIALIFSTVVYWLSNFRPTASAFFTWIMWLFLDLLAAESLVVLVSSAVPVFVVALAGTAFANGLWMCTGGFLVPLGTLNPFWKYVFHFIDYQSYVFQGMMVNEFRDRNFTCESTMSGGCSCMYETDLQEQCMIAGQGVLSNYGYRVDGTTKWVACLIAIIFGYRCLAWLTLHLRRT